MILIVAGRRRIFEDLCRKLDLVPSQDVIYIHSYHQCIGLYADRIIFTCGYGEQLNDDELDGVAVRLKPNKEIEYISCCHLGSPSKDLL